MSRYERRRYLVSYDISDDQRREKVFHELHGFGDWAQYSVFLCELTAQEMVKMRRRLRDHIHLDEDQVMILDLGLARHALKQTLQVLGRSYEPPVRSIIV
jgi:CRISPR-associated protein Cas2